jgi:hypothetical protein
MIFPTEELHLICAYKGCIRVGPRAPPVEIASLGKHIAHARIFH